MIYVGQIRDFKATFVAMSSKSRSLVERTIGLIKQVTKCQTLDCRLDKDAWPELLTEVTFTASLQQSGKLNYHIFNTTALHRKATNFAD